MKNKSPAFQVYPKEWLSSATIAMMTPAQEGAYWRLLCYAWLDLDCSIPDDPKVLAHLSRVGIDEWDKGGYQVVIDCFKPHPSIPHRLVNERLLQEREKQHVWREKSAKGGKIGSAKRWEKRVKVENKGGHQMVNQPLQGIDNQTMTFQSPVSSLHNSTPIVPITAEQIYQAYPLKVGKPKALQAIQKALKKHTPELLLEKTKAYASTRAGDKAFVPHPSTWFNQERFNDDPATWVRVEPVQSRNGFQQTQRPSVVEQDLARIRREVDAL